MQTFAAEQEFCSEFLGIKQGLAGEAGIGEEGVRVDRLGEWEGWERIASGKGREY